MNFTPNFVSHVGYEITNLAIPLSNCQSNRELRNEVVNFTPNFVSHVGYEITNLAIPLSNCQSNRELRNEVVNFTPNFVGQCPSSSRAKFASSGVGSLVF